MPNKNSEFDDDFAFEEAEPVGGGKNIAAGPSASNKNAQQLLALLFKHRKILLLIGSIILTAIFMFFGKSNKEKPKPPIENIANTARHLNKETIDTVAKSREEINKMIKQLTTQAETADSEYKNEVKHSLTSINNEINQHFQFIQQLKDTLTDISGALANLNQQVAAIDARVGNLSDNLASLTTDISGVKKVIAEQDLDIVPSNTKPKATRPSLTYKAPEYVVHAIIPGRAWLKSSAGQIITVAEGDLLGDYGSVARINADDNTVLTSSGVTFR
jgi:hypothetical protein